MEHAFSRIAAILTAVLLLFLVPLLINMQRQESMVQLAIMQDTVQFVDSVRNMGVVTKDMYNEYQNQIRRIQEGLDIYMEHTQQNLFVGEDKVRRTQVKYTEKDIVELLEEYSIYSFQKGDYLRVEVRKRAGFLERFMGVLLGNSSTEQNTYVYYGGSIRYETQSS